MCVPFVFSMGSNKSYIFQYRQLRTYWKKGFRFEKTGFGNSRGFDIFLKPLEGPNSDGNSRTFFVRMGSSVSVSFGMLEDVK